MMTFMEYLITEATMDVPDDPSEAGRAAQQRARMDPRRQARARMDALDAEEKAHKASGVKDPEKERIMRMKKQVATAEMRQANQQKKEPTI
jgi:hypothetical protein